MLLASEGTSFIPCGLVNIQEKLRVECQSILSSDLIRSLNLGDLIWSQVQGDNMNPPSDLYVGHPSKRRNMSPDINFALGTIQIVRVPDVIAEDRKYLTLGVQVAGLTHDTTGDKRVLGIEYLGNAIHRVGVSIKSPTESSRLSPYYVPIPTKRNFSGYTAGIITPAMVEATNGHDQMAQASTPPGQTNKPIFFNGVYGSQSRNQEGFTVVRDSEEDVLKLVRSSNRRSSNKPWLVSVPAYLQKVT